MELIQPIIHILEDLLQIVVVILSWAAQWGVLIAWLAWWLCGVNWRKLWPVLAEGGWAPLVLLAIAGAMVWAQIAPADYSFLGIFTLPNFWWQLGGVSLLIGATLFCGWLQEQWGLTPAEISLEPPVHDHGHGHGHDHGHH